MDKFYTYIIQSKLDDSFYIEYTSDLENRLKFHNLGLSTYTSRKKPWKIVYFESFENKSEAIKREKFLKKQRNSTFYINLIKSFRSRSSAG